MRSQIACLRGHKVAFVRLFSQVHFWKERPIGFWQVQKAGQSRHLFLIDIFQTKNTAIFQKKNLTSIT